ncbi:hypothetical protein PTSG_08354 [Salpingoeca rosetta]|uniref:NYN domain-containing protein n=1 Tax=Salpingoeca rosetta (strain ATCC 50818 / BSB-021) TaxID=946362 RepID=F2UJG1_SALR5|nr:uncharacterized protein PTSG_08354 [Salpingoeca rosetta]EGD77260.1 hypothetical protein PTSG_08354 [Salpingoeca rosetta]|eukprot:XP_004990604.1 hypothetical protein PTSG_08354 [Salpingoeca rosetta]
MDHVRQPASTDDWDADGTETGPVDYAYDPTATWGQGMQTSAAQPSSQSTPWSVDAPPAYSQAQPPPQQQRQHHHHHHHHHHQRQQQHAARASSASYSPRALIPNAPLFSRQDLQRHHHQQQQQKLSVLHEHLSLSIKATTVKATKATIRVPLVAARIITYHESLLQKFQLLTNITYITCCSNLNSGDNLAELLVRGTKDSVQHARDALQRLADSVKLEDLPAAPAQVDARSSVPPSASAPSGHSALQKEDRYGRAGSDWRARHPSPEADYAAPQGDQSLRVGLRTSPHMAGRVASAPPHSLAYVFVDNSNVFIGAQLESSVRDLAVRVNIRSLCGIIEDNMPCAFRAVAGTNPHSGRIWHEWENNHYCTLLDRSDASMHNVIAAKIVEVANSGANPQTLVLVTGDGNEVEGNESFPRLAERAIQHGWRVRVWSWEQSLSGKFRDLKERFRANITIHFLDPFRERIIFKAGQGSRSVSSGPTSTSPVTRAPAGDAMPHRGSGHRPSSEPVGSRDVDADPYMLAAQFHQLRFNGFPPHANAGMMQGAPPPRHQPQPQRYHQPQPQRYHQPQPQRYQQYQAPAQYQQQQQQYQQQQYQQECQTPAQQQRPASPTAEAIQTQLYSIMDGDEQPKH